MPYKYIFFDIDNTLINFHKSFYEAAKHVLTMGQHEITDEALDEYFSYNDLTWFGLDLHHVEREYIRRNYHSLYHRYLHDSTDTARKKMKLAGDTPSLLECFIREFGACAVPSPYSVEVCKKLSVEHTLCIATNGLNCLQPGKINAFKPYMSRIYVSEAIGFIKPEPEYFEHIIRDLGCSRSECLMVGDSLTNDIAGASSAGIDSCLYDAMQNPGASPYDAPSEICAAYRISDFRELFKIV